MSKERVYKGEIKEAEKSNMSNIGKSFLGNMRFKIKFKVYISVSDLVRAEESQRVIDELKELYDDNKFKDAELIRVTPFTNGYLRGINISIKCIGRDEARKYRKEFNKIYKHKIEVLERKPCMFISLLNLEYFKIEPF